MKYLFLLYGPDGPLPEPGTAEHAAMTKRWGEAKEGMRSAGVLIECSPLYPAAASTTLRVRNGDVLLTDGPAAEIKEHFGGITLVECADLDEALKWAATLPSASEGSIEIRPLIGGAPPA